MPLPVPFPSAPEVRRAAFVAAARDAFFTHGYAGTTMSSIAACVGGSKTTLWSYFPSKAELFAAVVDEIVDHYGAALAFPFDVDEPVPVVLERFGSALMATILSPPILALHRLVAGEAGRFTELGALFYERGPKRGKARLAEFIEDAMARGALSPGDPKVAARQFAGMCQAGVFQQAIYGFDSAPDPAEIARDVDAAVASFMRAWGEAA